MSEAVKGKLIEINDEVQINDTFKKRTFAVETVDGEYSQFLEFELVQDATSKIDEFSIGQSVEVFFNLRGRKWKGDDGIKYFMSCNAWKIVAN